LQAISLGIPVVSEEWFHQSSKKEFPLDLTDFKSSRFCSSSEKVKSHNAKKEDLLFSDKSFALGEFKSKEESNLVRFVVTHLGGRVSQSKEKSDFIVSDSSSKSTSSEEEEDGKVVRVTPKFVLDSVEKQVLQSPSDY